MAVAAPPLAEGALQKVKPCALLFPIMKAISYTRTALKQLRSIDAQAAKLIRAKIEQYAGDPKNLANQVKALKGTEALRLRVGDYRVIFTEDGLVLLILRVGHRRDIYE
jgi:mRNA interferase RelE/StbE